MKIIPCKKNNTNKIILPNKFLDMDMAFIDKISNIVSTQESLSLIFKKMNTINELKKINSSLYRYKNFDFHIGSSYVMQNTAKNLIMLEAINSTCKPKFIKTAKSRNNAYQLIVTKTPNNIIPYAEKEKQVDTEQKLTFINEMREIASKLNVYNPCVLDKTNWSVDESGNIYIQDWSSLKEFADENDKQKYLRILSKELDLIYY